jgi:hypothetical protein
LSVAVLLVALGGATTPVRAQTVQLESCRRSVVERYSPYAPNVSVTLAGQDFGGNVSVKWSAVYSAGSGDGTCTVDKAGRTLQVDVANSTGPGGPQIQPPVTPPVGPAPVTPGLGATRVTCESVEARRKECAIPLKQQVRLVRTMSVNPCTEGRTWGKADRIIWVTSGCRGEFEVSAPPVVDPGFGAGTVRRMTCGSPTGQQLECKTGGYATQVRLVRDLSNGRCRQGSSWGNTDSFIWANKGCRAEFEVTYRGTVTPGPGSRHITCGTGTATQVQCATQGEASTIRLVRNLSTARCLEKSNWGYTSKFIWANQGCRGEFEVTYRGTTPAPPTPPAPRTITCGNTAGADMSCNPMGTVASIRLLRDLSGRCRQNSTWGFTRSDLWVRQGCYGQFQITYAAAPPPQLR